MTFRLPAITIRRPWAKASPTGAPSAAVRAAESVGHFVCSFCYPNAGVPAVSFCGSTRPPRLTKMSGEHLTRCPICWDVFDRGGFCAHYHAPRGGRP